jgi:hypothetical protein
MAGFNFTATVIAAVDSGSLRATAAEIRRALGDVRADVSVNVSPSASVALGNLNGQLSTLQSNLAAASASAAQNAQTITQTAVAYQQLAAAQTAANAGTAAGVVQARGLAAGWTGLLGNGRQLLALAGSLGAAFTFGSAVSEAADFERRLIRLSQVTGESRESLRGIAAEAAQLGIRYGESAKDLIDVETRLRQAGQTGNEAKASLLAVAQAAQAPSFGNVEQAGRGAVSLFKQFGLAGQELAAALGSVDAISSKFSVDANELTRAVDVGGTVFKAAGGSLREYLAILATVKSASGESADAVAQSLNRVFTKLQSAPTLDALARLGIQLRDNGQFVGPLSAIERIRAGLAGIPTNDQRYESVVTQLGGSRAASRIIPLLTKPDKLQEALAVGDAGSSKLAVDAAKAEQSLAVRLGGLRQELEQTKRALLDDSGLRHFTDLSLNTADAVLQLTKNIGPLVTVLGALGAARGISYLQGALPGNATLLKFAGLAAASYAPTISRSLFPDNPEAQGIGGAVQGGVTGGIIGSVIGPWGTALGAATGAVVGFTSSLTEAEEHLRSVRAETNARDFSALIQDLAAGARPLSQENLQAQADRLRQFRTDANDKGFADLQGTRGTFGRIFGELDPAKLRQLQELDYKTSVGPNLPFVTQVANRQLETLAKTGADSTTVYQRFASSDAGRETIDALARGTDRTLTDVQESLKRVAEAAVRRAHADEQAAKVTLSTSAAFGTLESIIRGVESASAGLANQENAYRLQEGFLQGRASAIPLPSSAGLKSIGAPDPTAFLHDLDRVTAQFGQVSTELNRQARSADELVRILPGILQEANARGPAEGTDFAERVRDALSRHGGLNDQHVESVLNRIEQTDLKEPGTFQRRLTEVGSGRAADELTRDVVAPVQELQRLSQTLTTAANSFVHGIAENEDAVRAFGTEQSKLDLLRLNVTRNSALRLAQSVGRPSSAGDFLSLQQAQQPFEERQRRLAGAVAFDPEGIAERYRDTVRRAEEVRQRRDAAPPGSETFAVLAREFGHLQSEATNLKQALVNLTDAAGRNAAIQEKLASIQQDRDSRLSFGGRFIRADYQERAQLTRGLTLTQIAGRTGSLDQFLQPDQRLILETLSSLGNAKLTGLGGITARDLEQNLVRRFNGGVFDLAPGDRAHEAELKSAYDQNLKVAAAAQEKFVSLQQGLQEKFFSRLQESQTAFLANLRQAMTATQLLQVEQRKDRLIAEEQPLIAKKRQADELQAVGVTDDNLSLFRAPDNLKRLRGYASAAGELRSLQESDRARIAELQGKADQRQPFGVALGSEDFDVGGLFVSGQEKRIRDASTRDETKRALSDFLRAQGLDSLDVGRVVQGYAKQNLASRAQFESISTRAPAGEHDDGRFRPESRGAEEVSAVLRSNLLTAIRAEAGRTEQAQRAGIADRAGIDTSKLDRLFQSLAENGSKLTGALEAVDGIKQAADKLQAIEGQLAETNRAISALRAGADVQHKATGGAVYAHAGANIFKPAGTDTVPAMLTPGEFVVNRDAAVANRELLEHVNASRGQLAMIGGGASYSFPGKRTAYLAGGGAAHDPSEDLRQIAREALWARRQAVAQRPRRSSRHVDPPRLEWQAADVQHRFQEFDQAYNRKLEEVLAHGGQTEPQEAKELLRLYTSRANLKRAHDYSLAAAKRASAGAETRINQYAAELQKRSTGSVASAPTKEQDEARRTAVAHLRQAEQSGDKDAVAQARADYDKAWRASHSYAAAQVTPRAPSGSDTGRRESVARLRDAERSGDPDAVRQARKAYDRSWRERHAYVEPVAAASEESSAPESAAFQGPAQNPYARPGNPYGGASSVPAFTSPFQNPYGERPNPYFDGQTLPPERGAAVGNDTVAQSLYFDLGGNVPGMLDKQRWDVTPGRRPRRALTHMPHTLEKPWAAGTPSPPEPTGPYNLPPERGAAVGNEYVIQPLHRAMGGGVPGDTVPAMLTPGEYVLNRQAAAAIGYDALNRANHFAQGGAVGAGSQEMGSTFPSEAITAMNGFGSSARELQGGFRAFAGTASALAEAMKAFPSQLKITGHQTVEVVHNGIEMFSKMEPLFAKMVEEKTQATIQKVFKQHLPDATQPTFD